MSQIYVDKLTTIINSPPQKLNCSNQLNSDSIHQLFDFFDSYNDILNDFVLYTTLDCDLKTDHLAQNQYDDIISYHSSIINGLSVSFSTFEHLLYKKTKIDFEQKNETMHTFFSRKLRTTYNSIINMIVNSTKVLLKKISNANNLYTSNTAKTSQFVGYH